MKESEFLGTLLPSHPDLIPIEIAIRGKYNLPEISPDDESITEIFLGDEIVPLEEFRNDINRLVHENLSFIPPDLLKLYFSAKAFSITQFNTQHQAELGSLPADIKDGIEASIKFIGSFSNIVIQIIDPMINAIVNMLYIHLLTGETEEVPNDWISKVATITAMGEPMVLAMAGPMSNLDVIIQQFREEYKKTFGNYRPKITKIHTSTAYYLQLKKARKPWNFIVEEYIRLNQFSLPRDKGSPRYYETWHRYESRLKKRIQRTEAVFEILIRDKK